MDEKTISNGTTDVLAFPSDDFLAVAPNGNGSLGFVLHVCLIGVEEQNLGFFTRLAKFTRK